MNYKKLEIYYNYKYNVVTQGVKNLRDQLPRKRVIWLDNLTETVDETCNNNIFMQISIFQQRLKILYT